MSQTTKLRNLLILFINDAQDAHFASPLAASLLVRRTFVPFRRDTWNSCPKLLDPSMGSCPLAAQYAVTALTMIIRDIIIVAVTLLTFSTWPAASAARV